MDQTTNNSEYVPSGTVPPPPSETTIRTMASDIASVAQSGGGAPKAKQIKILSLSEQSREPIVPQVGVPAPEPAAPRAPKESFFSSPVFMISAALVFLVGAFLASYFVIYPLLNPKPAPSLAQKPAAPAETKTQETIAQANPIFGQPVDGIFTLDVISAVDGMEAERGQISSFISGVSGSFFQIMPRDAGGQYFSSAEFLSAINANILDSDFLNVNFEKNFALFVFKDKSGIWPGYVFQLSGGKTPILLQNGVSRKIENASSSWNNIFMEPPGNPSDAGFQSGLSAGQPIRTLTFSNSSSVIAYGWFLNKYLVVSTSLDGLKQAADHF